MKRFEVQRGHRQKLCIFFEGGSKMFRNVSHTDPAPLLINNDSPLYIDTFIYMQDQSHQQIHGRVWIAMVCILFTSSNQCDSSEIICAP